MRRKKSLHLYIIIAFAVFCLSGIPCKQVEAGLNTGNITVTSQRYPSPTLLGEKTSWASCEERFIPLGTEISLCWDDIGLDLNETENLSVIITDPNGKRYDDLSWEIHNHYDNPIIGPMLGWAYIKGPGHSFGSVMYNYYGVFPDYNIQVAQMEKGVKFYGYAAITFSEKDPVGLYTGTVKVGDEILTTSWYVIDKPISFLSNILDQNVTVGDPATFSVSATGSNLNYQWFYNTVDSYDGGKKIDGATDASYTLDNVSLEDNGRYYYCQVSNRSANDKYSLITKYSSRARLSVYDKSEVPVSTGTIKGTETVRRINITGKLLSVKSKTKRKITIKWKKLQGISGYQINISKNKTFNKSIIQRKYNAKKQTVKISNLSSGKKYYIRVRPYKKVKSSIIYGNWSKVKKVKVK